MRGARPLSEQTPFLRGSGPLPFARRATLEQTTGAAHLGAVDCKSSLFMYHVTYLCSGPARGRASVRCRLRYDTNSFSVFSAGARMVAPRERGRWGLSRALWRPVCRCHVLDVTSPRARCSVLGFCTYLTIMPVRAALGALARWYAIRRVCTAALGLPWRSSGLSPRVIVSPALRAGAW